MARPVKFPTFKLPPRKPKEEAPPPPRADRITRAVMWTADKAVLTACLLVILACCIIDVVFFSSTGGKLWPVFLIVGLVFRFFSVGLGPVLQSLRGQKAARDTRRTLRTIQLLCFIACLYPPMNFFAASHFQKMHEANAITATASASTGSKEQRIARLEQRRKDAAGNRDAAIKAASDTASIIKDQVVGTSSSDNQTLRALSVTAATAVSDFTKTDGEISKQIDAIELERETVQTDAAGKEAVTYDTWPVFIWLGEQFPLLGKNPDGTVKLGSHLIWANWSLFFFAMLVEFCALLGLGAYTRAHGHFQVVLDALSRKAVIPDAPVVIQTPAPPAAPVPKPAPPPLDELTLDTPVILDPDEARREHMRRIGKKGRASQEHTRNAEDDALKVPVDDWRDRHLNGHGAEA